MNLYELIVRTDVKFKRYESQVLTNFTNALLRYTIDVDHELRIDWLTDKIE